MRTSGFLLLLLMTTSVIQAQTLKSKASVKLSTDKNVELLSPNIALDVYSQPESGGWYDLRLRFFVDQSSLENDTLSEGAKMYDEKGAEIGTTKVLTTILHSRSALGKKNKGKIEVIIPGKVFRTQFEKNTVPEMVLEDILNGSKKGMMSREIDDWVQNLKIPAIDEGDFTFYSIERRNYAFGDQDEFKILLVYKRGGAFYGIITNGFKLEIPVKFDVHDEPFHMYFPLTKATDRDVNQLKELMFEFIPL